MYFVRIFIRFEVTQPTDVFAFNLIRFFYSDAVGFRYKLAHTLQLPMRIGQRKSVYACTVGFASFRLFYLWFKSDEENIW